MKTQFHLTWLFLISLSHSLYATENLATAPQEMSYCDQVLIQASIGCMEEPENKLESCIIDTLKKDNCEVEIVSEADVNVCEEEQCARTENEGDMALEMETQDTEQKTQDNVPTVDKATNNSGKETKKKSKET